MWPGGEAGIYCFRQSQIEVLAHADGGVVHIILREHTIAGARISIGQAKVVGSRSDFGAVVNE